MLGTSVAAPPKPKTLRRLAATLTTSSAVPLSPAATAAPLISASKAAPALNAASTQTSAAAKAARGRVPVVDVYAVVRAASAASGVPMDAMWGFLPHQQESVAGSSFGDEAVGDAITRMVTVMQETVVGRHDALRYVCLLCFVVIPFLLTHRWFGPRFFLGLSFLVRGSLFRRS